MSDTLATFQVFNHEAAVHCNLRLVYDPDNAHFDAVERDWDGILKAAQDRAAIAYTSLPSRLRTEDQWQALQAKFGAPDSHWDWRDKQQNLRPASQRLLALLNGNFVEALMLIDLSRNSRLVSSPIAQIVYVENVAVAPWNRPPIQNTPKFRGLGRLMIGVAVAISQQEHLNGRCGLHSLIQSEGFYRKLGMTDLGPDPAVEDLRYFEFDPIGASNFIGGP